MGIAHHVGRSTTYIWFRLVRLGKVVEVIRIELTAF
jgi:hypothetical protein